MNKEEFLKRLHPSISHINVMDDVSEETLEAINIMVDKVAKMSTKELNDLLLENRKPQFVIEAEKLIKKLQSTSGFMGSPDYFLAQKVVNDYYASNKK